MSGLLVAFGGTAPATATPTAPVRVLCVQTYTGPPAAIAVTTTDAVKLSPSSLSVTRPGGYTGTVVDINVMVNATHADASFLSYDLPGARRHTTQRASGKVAGKWRPGRTTDLGRPRRRRDTRQLPSPGATSLMRR
ncbi:hypothetical protein [Nocardioides sp. B-3]|uniref:hypothetical protein n=1 Tax=Nocardioides sp. B-3 TaxID=2895565 RepID=UPI0021530237|nr:hypothetical protein [Nocardioides sp. B-3]UUZ60593.1 hypothetical protein LP418_06960 [Nocardioides sp. B-3]